MYGVSVKKCVALWRGEGALKMVSAYGVCITECVRSRGGHGAHFNTDQASRRTTGKH